ELPVSQPEIAVTRGKRFPANPQRSLDRFASLIEAAESPERTAQVACDQADSGMVIAQERARALQALSKLRARLLPACPLERQCSQLAPCLGDVGVIFA